MRVLSAALQGLQGQAADKGGGEWARPSRATAREVPEGPMTVQLRWWLDHIAVRPDSSIGHRLLVWVRGSKVWMAINVAVMMLSVTDLVLIGSLFKGQVAARFSMGVYSCLWTQAICLRRSHVLRGCLQSLGNLASVLEIDGTHPKSLLRMQRSARRCDSLFRFYVFYSVSTQLVILVTFSAVEPKWHRAAAAVLAPGDRQDFLSSAMRWSALVFQMTALFSCLSSFYTVVSCIIVIYSATSDVYDVIGRSLEEMPCSPRWPAMQRQLLWVSLRMDEAIAGTVPHMLVVVVILPLLSTVEVVGNGMQADVFAVGTAPLILTVFMPLCLVGDAVTSSRRAVAVRAIRGPWLEEALAAQRLRLGLITAALGRGAKVRGRGIGVLDKRACGNALRSWFSFLQILMNVQGRVENGGGGRRRLAL